MRIMTGGKITENFYALGLPAVPVLLLDGPVPVLFDAGFSALASIYEKAIKGILGTRSPSYLFLTHAHWDHIGSAGHFKELWPDMVIAGPVRIRETLKRPGALESIKRLNEEGARALRAWGESTQLENPFKPFDLDLAFRSDEIIELSRECRVSAIRTPGHTWDQTSYWIPDKKILVASEAVGCEHGGHIVTEFLVDYDAYRSSLEKLASLQPEVLCVAHQMVVTGPDVGDYLRRSLEAANAFLDMVEAFLEEEKGDIEKTVARVKTVQWDILPEPKQPEPAYLLNTRARVRHIWERMEKQDRRPATEGQGEKAGREEDKKVRS